MITQYYFYFAAISLNQHLFVFYFLKLELNWLIPKKVLLLVCCWFHCFPAPDWFETFMLALCIRLVNGFGPYWIVVALTALLSGWISNTFVESRNINLRKFKYCSFCPSTFVWVSWRRPASAMKLSWICCKPRLRSWALKFWGFAKVWRCFSVSSTWCFRFNKSFSYFWISSLK